MSKTKNINGFENSYTISENAIITSIDRFIIDKNGKKNRINGLIKKKTINTDGYEVVSLFKNNKQNILYVHRLIAEHFIDNPKKLPCVNHINGIKNDNSISNLEWCSYSENNLHAYLKLNKVGYWKGKKSKNGLSKIVVQYDLNGNKISEYNSITECAKIIGLKRETIRDNVNGKIKIILGKYKFQTKND
jgi:hypothetical protein